MVLNQTTVEGLRLFCIDDVPDVVEIHNANNPEAPTTPEVLEAVERGRNPENTFIQFVIERDNHVVAYADCGDVHATKADDTFHLWITVHPQYGRQGLGVALLEKSINFAKQHHISQLITACAETHPHAITWLEKRNFERIGHFFELCLDLTNVGDRNLQDNDSLEKITARGLSLKAIATELQSTPDAIQRLFETLSLPLLREVVLPGGATINPSYEEFKAMEFDRPDVNLTTQFLLIADHQYVSWFGILKGTGESAFVNAFDVNHSYRAPELVKLLLLYIAQVARSQGYRFLRIHSGIPDQTTRECAFQLGFTKEPGRLIWKKAID